MSKQGHVRVGVGGWNYEPWRGTFYPPGTPQSGELEYASRQVTAIEINGTYYRLQKPAVYAKWRDATPEHFVFSLKAPRFIVQRKELAGAGPSIERFVASGIAELGAKLGPLLWQFEPWRHFDAADFGAFLEILPRSAGGLTLRHVVEARHKSFLTLEFLALARRHGIAVVFVDDAKYPAFADITADFVYARLRRCDAAIETGYAQGDLAMWASRAKTWAQGSAPADLTRLEPKIEIPRSARDVFVYFINGAKEKAPAAARALIARLA
ncbi:MAG TPA: DUF72 domain-containing protein [Steroidobacteraceae bacterium]|jgi:uncharacterized protein YecE (DUF72 family)|nr:DUF72 domain-containing protein [Steroidobacteraceae bacterium]